MDQRRNKRDGQLAMVAAYCFGGSSVSAYDICRQYDEVSISPVAGNGLTCLEPWEDAPRRAMKCGSELAIAVIDERSLIAECLATSLRSVDPSLAISQFRSSLDYMNATQHRAAIFSVAMICITSPENDPNQLLEAVRLMKSSEHAADIILFVDTDDVSFLLDAIRHGVRGYISSSSSLEVSVEAIKLVAAGGVYVPASSVFSLERQLSKATKADEEEHQSMFTLRQMSVLEALRSGKANKTIAYHLNMCESTVKVHVRNIMKRLNAKNRTEVAYILNKMEQEGRGFDRRPTTNSERNTQSFSRAAG
jgi:DNA-binding NarL/FixJ family response regulator